MASPENSKSLGSRLADQDLRNFATQLVEEKKFEGLDEETKQQLVDDVYDRLEERVNAVILASLPPEKVEQLLNLLDNGQAKEVSDFTETNIPGLKDILAEALASFRATYLGLA